MRRARNIVSGLLISEYDGDRAYAIHIGGGMWQIWPEKNGPPVIVPALNYTSVNAIPAFAGVVNHFAHGTYEVMQNIVGTSTATFFARMRVF